MVKLCLKRCGRKQRARNR
uniref:30S ribosomal protein S16 n=1 Tax=Allium nigrum TaxID=165640 RepID=A0A895G666_9ASPA|nr:30S ribosomal protein S16 [Allium nigrum]QRZ02417.1 30S ribosomal protein S16 [Allium nigrum]